MANKKITELDAATSLASTDVVPVVDVSADVTKKITTTDLFRTLPDGTAAAPALAFSSDAANGVYLAGTDTVGISTGGTQRVTVDGSGNVTISGNLQVDGATTTVQSTTVTIDDKNLELGSVASPSNTTADGGGITLKGATDKTIKWINSTGYWTFNTGIDVTGEVQCDSLDVDGGADITGNVVLHNHLDLGDDNHIRLGAGDDLKIYHDGSTSFIRDAGTGVLAITSNGGHIALLNGDATENLAKFIVDGAAELYYNGAKKIETLSTGASVTGNLGVGTTSPLGTLSVGNHANTAGELNDIYISGDKVNADGYFSRLLFKNSTQSGGSTASVRGERLGDNFGTALTFYTQATGSAGDGSERLRIDSSGRVGIGQSSPNALLEVNSGTAGNEVQRIEGNYSGSGSVVLSNWRRAGGAVAGAFKYNDATTSMSFGTTTSHSLMIRTGDSDRLTIDSSGLVGIGESSPTQMLVIRKDSASTSAGQYPVIDLRNDNASGFSQIRFMEGGTENASIISSNADNDLRFRNNGANERMRIDSNGLVGIGTSSPVSIFHVKAASETVTSRDGVLFESSSSLAADTGLPLVFTSHIGNVANYGVASIAGRKENATFANGAGYLQFGTGSAGGAISEKMRIDSSGNVGIGTTNPTQKLSLENGTFKISGTSTFASNVEIGRVGNDNNLAFATGGTERLRITSTGAWAIEGASNYGSSGQVLTSNGNDAPTWQDAASASVGGSSAINMNDSVPVRFGNGQDLEIYHDGSNSYVNHSGTGDLIVRTTADDKDVILATDNGSGGITNYVLCDGSQGSVKLNYLGSEKLQTKSDGILVQGEVQSDSLDVNGNADISGNIVLNGDLDLQDSNSIKLGTGDDFHLIHNGSNTHLENYTGGYLIDQNADDGYIVLRADDGSGGLANYVYCDGNSGVVNLGYYGATKLNTKSDGIDVSGEVQCDSLDVDGDADFGAGKINFDDGGNVLDFADSVAARFGTGNDLRIYHDGSNSFINEAGTGGLIVKSGDIYLRNPSDGDMIHAQSGGYVKLYHAGNQKLETTSDGISVTGEVVASGQGQFKGAEGASAFLYLYADEGDDNADKFRIEVGDGGPFKIQNFASGGWETNIECNGNDNVQLYYDNVVKLKTQTNGIMIGASNSTYNEVANQSNTAKLHISGGGSGSGNIEVFGSNHSANSKEIHMSTNSSLRLKVTQTGLLHVGTTTADGSAHVFATSAPNSFGFVVHNTNSNNSVATAGLKIKYSVAPNDTNSAIQFHDSSASRFFVRNNGNVESSSNSFGPVSSDERLKQDIVDAGPQWDDIKAVRLKKFRYKNDPEGDLQLGPIAQELETVSPGLITRRPADEDEIADTSNTLVDGDEVLSFKASVLYMKAIKALQEAMARIEELEAKVAALEAS